DRCGSGGDRPGLCDPARPLGADRPGAGEWGARQPACGCPAGRLRRDLAGHRHGPRRLAGMGLDLVVAGARTGDPRGATRGAGGPPVTPQLGLNVELELAMRLGVGLVLGAVIGFERELHRQPAGFRTHALVALGSALFTIVSAYGFAGSNVDPTRIAAKIVSGIGFIGAGTILQHRGNIRGLTTAASLWSVAAIGMAAGAG